MTTEEQWFEKYGDAAIKQHKSLILCDGCNVRKGWEHRCHNVGFVSYIMVKGERHYHRCDCQECNM